jgi:hypothetical protein
MIDQVNKTLIGKRCHAFRLIEGGTLILYLDSDRKNTLWIDCAWRLRDASMVISGSLNEEDELIEALKNLEGRYIETVNIEDVSKDLTLTFTQGLIIETFSHSTIDEVWEIRLENGQRIGVGASLQFYENNVTNG